MQTCSCYLVWTVLLCWWWSSKLASWSDWKQWLLQVSSLWELLGLSLVTIHMHYVQVETLCCPSLDWGGHSLLQIFLMTQSLDASVSGLMYVRLIGKSVLWWRISFCTTVLNSTGWNSFLTSCPLCLLAELLLCVQYIFLYSGIVTVRQSNLTVTVN